MIVFLSIYVLGIIGFLIHLFSIDKRQRTKAKIVELFLLYQIVFSLGITSLLAFISLTLIPEFIADYTDWPPSPFEQQLANVNLAFCTLGILCIWFRGNFWLATIVGFSVWILSDGIQHIYDSIADGNMSPGNIGVPLWTDIIVPLLLLALLLWHRKLQKKKCID